MRKLWALFTSLFGSGAKDRPPARVPFDVQMQAFEQIGIRLNPGITKDDLFDIFALETLESDPHDSLYAALGSARELDEDAHFTNQIWYFDTEGIIESLEYERLLRNIGRISGAELRFSNVKVEYRDDETDPVATVTFDLNGSQLRWTIHPFSDWDTPAFLTPINEYARSHGLKGRLTWNRSRGPGLGLRMAHTRADRGSAKAWSRDCRGHTRHNCETVSEAVTAGEP